MNTNSKIPSCRRVKMASYKCSILNGKHHGGRDRCFQFTIALPELFGIMVNNWWVGKMYYLVIEGLFFTAHIGKQHFIQKAVLICQGCYNNRNLFSYNSVSQTQTKVSHRRYFFYEISFLGLYRITFPMSSHGFPPVSVS